MTAVAVAVERVAVSVAAPSPGQGLGGTSIYFGLQISGVRLLRSSHELRVLMFDL